MFVCPEPVCKSRHWCFGCSHEPGNGCPDFAPFNCTPLVSTKCDCQGFAGAKNGQLLLFCFSWNPIVCQGSRLDRNVRKTDSSIESILITRDRLRPQAVLPMLASVTTQRSSPVGFYRRTSPTQVCSSFFFPKEQPALSCLSVWV